MRSSPHVRSADRDVRQHGGQARYPAIRRGGADDARFVPLPAPTRIVDTRRGLGGGALGAGQTRVFDGAPVVTPQTLGIAANLTLVAPTSTTFLTLWPSDVARPEASNVNAGPGKIVANAAVIGLGYPPRPGTDAFHGFNAASTANLLVDAAGTFELAAPATAATTLTAGRVSDARSAATGGPSAAR